MKTEVGRNQEVSVLQPESSECCGSSSPELEDVSELELEEDMATWNYEKDWEGKIVIW